MNKKTQKIKVMIAINSLGGGGAERVVSRILRSLDRDRFSAVLLLFERKGVFLSTVPADVPIRDCGRYAQGGRYSWLWNFVGTLRQEEPDVLVTFISFTNVISVVARCLSRVACRLILSERVTIQGSGEGFLTELLRRLAIRIFYRAADRVVPNSESLRRQLVDDFHLGEKKVTTIENPVDIEAILAQRSETDTNEDPAGLPIVAAMGRLSRQKGFDLLIQAARVAKIPFKLVLLGEGREEENLSKLSHRLGITGRVVFAGFQKNPYALLSKAAVFVLPSRYEGFPNALLEAMALGVPCIATRCPTGPEEIITDGVDGLLVPVEDPKALAEAIERLLSEPGLRDRLGRAAMERAKNFDAPRIIKRFEALLEEVTA